VCRIKSAGLVTWVYMLRDAYRLPRPVDGQAASLETVDLKHHHLP
jgi:hypothetical protein